MNWRDKMHTRCKLILSIICVMLATNTFADSNLEQQTQELQQQINLLQTQIKQLESKVKQLELEQNQTQLFKAPTNDQKSTTKPVASKYGMEKCRVVDNHGNGLIKPYMADSGNNLAGDRDAWIWVPHGQCQKINKGDFSGISDETRYKIHDTNIIPSATYQ